VVSSHTGVTQEATSARTSMFSPCYVNSAEGVYAGEAGALEEAPVVRSSKGECRNATAALPGAKGTPRREASAAQRTTPQRGGRRRGW